MVSDRPLLAGRHDEMDARYLTLAAALGWSRNRFCRLDDNVRSGAVDDCL
jgi:hypothetical protein